MNNGAVDELHRKLAILADAALLRIPGIGARVVKRILAARRHVTLRLDDLARLVRSLESVRPFVVTPDWSPKGILDSASLGSRLVPAGPRQLDLFA